MKRGGRPRVPVRLETLSVRLPVPVHDALYRLALRRQIGLSELLRLVISDYLANLGATSPASMEEA